MVKAYYKFSPYSLWGVVASRRVPCVIIDKQVASRFFQTNSLVVATAAVSVINLWNIRKIERVGQLGNLEDEEITVMYYATGSKWLVAGYNNGRIRVFSLESRKLEFLIHSHTSPTTAIALDDSGLLLASGSGAGDVVLWDLSAEKGICRLKGHTNQVTKLQFYYFYSKQYLISISKDSLLKIWDLVGYSCVQTVVSSRGEWWDFHIFPKLNIIVTASSQPEVFGILSSETYSYFTPQESNVFKEEESPFIVSLGNTMLKSSKCTALSVDDSGCHLVCYENDKSLQVFQLRDWEHAIKHLKRRRKRQSETSSSSERKQEDLSILQPSDFLIYRQTLSFPHRIRCVHFVVSLSENQQKHSERFHQSMIMQFADNGLSLYDLAYEEQSDEIFTVEQVANLDTYGHRGDVRSLAFSSTTLNYLLSVSSAHTAKIWQVANNNVCLRTISLGGYGTCCLFICNDIFVAIGTKQGTLEIYYTLTGDSVTRVADHQGTVWSICKSFDEKYLFTGGSDKRIHIYEMVVSTDSGLVSLQLEHIRTLEMSDEVLCLKTTPDGKLLIVALLDCTVRSFYLDSLRFYLSFYGHKMPVLSMDVTSDSYLLVTGSADKSIKIWGLDFGDLHKSLLGHENAVMNITCQPNTHYFFSASRDGNIKYWDADIFRLVMTCKGHSGEVWTLSISQDGEWLASAGHDKSIRLWTRTEEQLFLEEEEERRLDESLEPSIIQERRWTASNLEASMQHVTLGMESIPQGTTIGNAATVSHMDIVTSCEKILEALELVRKEYEREQQEPEEPPDIQLLGWSRHMYLLTTLAKIRITDLESVLMLLPYYAAEHLLSCCSELLHLPCSRLYADLLCRVVLFLTQAHRSVITHGMDRGQMEFLAQGLHQLVDRSKKKVGFNIAAMKMIVALKDEEEQNIPAVAMETTKASLLYDNNHQTTRKKSRV